MAAFRSSLILLRCALVWTRGARALTSIRVRYGYFDESTPINAACGKGWLNLAPNATAQSPGYVVECFPQSSGVTVTSRLDNAQLDVASLGSSPWAEAVARGVALKEIYINHYKGNSQGIFVRNRGHIETPLDLTGSRIGTPFGSTSHIQVAYLIDIFQLQPVELVNLSPAEIIAAWDDPNDPNHLDGAACWGAAREHVLANGGRQLISARVIADWGMPTFNNVVARAAFAKEHPRFVTHLVGILSRINDSFLDRLGGKDPQNAVRWSVNGNVTDNFVESLVDSLMMRGEIAGNPSSRQLSTSREQLDLFDEQTATEQLACNFIGGPLGGCPTSALGQHVSGTIKTASFGLGIKRLASLGIMNQSTFREEDIIDPTYLNSSRTGNGVATPLGPYNVTLSVDNDLESPGPDAVLRQLETLDARTGRSPYATYEVGRASAPGGLTFGDSNCEANYVFDETSFNGTFGDGANGLPGLSYSDNKRCHWTIHPIENRLIEVRVQRLRVWSGDFVNIYSGGCFDNEPRILLAQISGMHEDLELPDALPPFRSSTCIVVEFVTDGRQERGYAVEETYGDGFEVSFSRPVIEEIDCNGRERDSNGLCLCGGETWGGDCSHTSFCIGTTHITMREEVMTLKSSSRVTKESLSYNNISQFIIGQDDYPYPNDLNCIYEMDFTGFDSEGDLFARSDDSEGELFAKIKVWYDLEETFDLLKLSSGSGQSSLPYNVLSGQSQGEIFFVPVDANSGMATLHLTTDDKGRRRGFYAEVSGEYATQRRPACEVGHFGSRCESTLCLQQNTFHQSKHGIRVTSQGNGSSIRAMPWAPEGGCVWEMKPSTGSVGAIRLNITLFHLEPYPANSVGDKVVIISGGGKRIELFTESCTTGEACDFSWQDGLCIDGRCRLKQQIELEVGADVNNTSMLLVTDRNDGGKNYRGVDFDVQHVQVCPAIDCSSAGGFCSDDGFCTCKDIACRCSCDSARSDYIYIVSGVVVSVLLLLFAAAGFAVHTKSRRRRMDLAWAVKKSELTYGDPPEVLGNGTFGLVLLAEYRGTQVAVKRVIPPNKNTSARDSFKEEGQQISQLGMSTLSSLVPMEEGLTSSTQEVFQAEAETETEAETKNTGEQNGNSPKRGRISLNNTKSLFQRKSSYSYDNLRKDFIEEMRQLSKLRHPCITTVMGAVICKNDEPLLIMEYMSNGSLYDLLHNETIIFEGDLLLPILRDVSQGIRFLHTASPQVIHGDLKAKNILVDNKFRAKVADFGLSQKKQVGATGTPYWMAPELLRKETTNNASTDVYAFGIILFEVYSRKDPYEDEPFADGPRDLHRLLRRISDPRINKRPGVPPSCPPQVKSLLADCLEWNPEIRPSFEEIDTRLRRLNVDTVEPTGRHLHTRQMAKEEKFAKRPSDRLRMTESLLYDVFPQHIAEVLRDGGKVEPDMSPCSTIFFSDIVAFTAIASELTPIKISDMLDRLYNKFDQLSKKHDVFKVETIGDSYMACSNLVKDQSKDHAKRIAQFSVDALQAANQTLIDIDDKARGFVNIRVGLHSGPVVANVVGSRNPRYCLFGDTVNVASRMESNSMKNRIHCSDRAAAVLREQYPQINIRSRGVIEVKGKGKMHTFWVNEDSPSTAETERYLISPSFNFNEEHQTT